MAQLALGTAQFGLDYGVTNTAGRVNPTIASTLLTKANQAGVLYIDTAQAYGNAEQVLGDVLPRPHSFRFISKLPVQSADQPFDDAREVIWQQSLHLTLKSLKISCLDGLLLHSAGDLARPDGHRLLNWLLKVQECGLVHRIGVSIYSAADLEQLPLSNLQLVQLPCSLYDQRLIADGTVHSLHRQGIAVHARSLYLQGLLVTPPNRWPQTAAPALLRHHERLHEWANRYEFSLVQLAITWARRQEWMEAAVVGVTTEEELDQLFENWIGPDPWQFEQPGAWAWPVGEDLDPRQWG